MTHHLDVIVISHPFAYLAFERLSKEFPNILFLNLTHGWEHRNNIAEIMCRWSGRLRGIMGITRLVELNLGGTCTRIFYI